MAETISRLNADLRYLDEATMNNALLVAEFYLNNNTAADSKSKLVGAASLYVAGRYIWGCGGCLKYELTQKKLAGMIGVTEITLRGWIKKIYESLPKDSENSIALPSKQVMHFGLF